MRGHSIHTHSMIRSTQKGDPQYQLPVSPDLSAGLSDGALALPSGRSRVRGPKCNDQTELGGVHLAQSGHISLKVKQTRTGGLAVVSAG